MNLKGARNGMKAGNWIVSAGVNRPWMVTGLMLLAALVLALLAALPSLAPETFPMLSGVKVDTDPENMLSRDEPERVFHNDMRRVMGLSEIVVVGVVNEEHPDGVFNPESLGAIYELTQFARGLRGAALGVEDPAAGILEVDLIAPSLVDNIEQGGPGEVKFEWLMPSPPQTREESLAVRDKALRIPFLKDTLTSADGRAVALYLPLTSKELSYRVYSALKKKIAEITADGGGDRFYVTGLPVAEDVFGVQMFIQMAISAPLAMLVIFLLMLFFFRKLVLVISPMIVAMVSVICTMGLLVATGNTIHIMSSMIPIFIMPIAVLDSIHILSEFFDRYQETRDRRKTVLHVMDSLFMPMLYTSLTSAAGFASLALTPIPPVQVFGMFVAFGIFMAWLLTVAFVPAYIMLLPERMLSNFGVAHGEDDDPHANTLLGRSLAAMGRFTYGRAKLVVALTVAVAAVAVYGMSLIQVNDNPIKWFRSSHEIRVADRVLNSHFAGSYMAYLALGPAGEAPAAALVPQEPVAADTAGEPALPSGMGEPELPAGIGGGEPGLPAGLGGEEPGMPAGLGGTAEPAAAPAAPAAPAGAEIFKDPAVLAYMEGLQAHLQTLGVVGKSNSLADIVKTVYRELLDGTDASYRIPDSSAGVAQSLLQYQSSHRPGDLWHFVTPDYRHTSMWVQLKSGDNLDMQRVIEAVDAYVAANPMTFTINGEEMALEHSWFGKTYLNVVWQQKMVVGMLNAFLGSFLVVLLMMILLFQSGLWGILSMIPLTITIGLIYGVIGLIGKDYDMPVAVLSSLTLGLAVDFAIHYLARARAIYEREGSWTKACPRTFGEPARAIFRNIVVIAVGFTPLLLAPLVPYNTVGVFLASILLVSGVATLVLLPALIRLLEPLLFPKTKSCSVACQCGTCILTSVVLVLLVWVNVYQFLEKGLTLFTVVSLAAVPALALVCWAMSRRAQCRPDESAK
jgi:uncharacterized protein